MDQSDLLFQHFRKWLTEKRKLQQPVYVPKSEHRTSHEHAGMLSIPLNFRVGMTEMKFKHSIYKIFVHEPQDILTFKFVTHVCPRED